MKHSYYALIPISFLLGSAVMTQSLAATVQLNYASKLRGPDLLGAPPWITTTFDDGGATGTVTGTIDTAGLTDNEKVRRLVFNLDPALDPRQLRFTYLSSSSAGPARRIRTGVNRFGAAQSGRYDVAAKLRGPLQLGAGQTLEYSISGIPALAANSFAVDAAAHCFWGRCTATSPYRAAALVTRKTGGQWAPRNRTWIAALNETSPTAVPVPGAVWLFGSGLMGLAGFARRHRAR